jgi:predicted GNAT superfamily acetyltransferase
VFLEKRSALSYSLMVNHSSLILYTVNYVIRDLLQATEIEALELIQARAWGYADRDIVPGAMMVVTAHSGGVVAAAYVAGERSPVGFVFGVPAVRPEHIGLGKLIHHSHMLAIVPEHRGTGLAQALKLHQRERAIGMGYGLMTWTMDPLVARNARLNLGKLSARAVAYHNDWYAARDLSTSLSADRFMIEWRLDREPVEHPVPKAIGPRALEAVDGNPRFGPQEPLLALNDPVMLIEVPRDIEGLKRDSLAQAQAWRTAHRVVFGHYFASGYAATDLTSDGERLFYSLERG